RVQVPVGDMARSAADLVEELLAGDGVGGDSATRGRWVIEQIPLGDVKIALGDLFAVAVAVGVVEADAGQAVTALGTNAAAVLAGRRDELLRPRVGHLRQQVALRLGHESRRIASLQTRVNVERRGGEGTQR